MKNTLLNIAGTLINILSVIAVWFAVNGHIQAGYVVKFLAIVTVLTFPLVLVVAFTVPGKYSLFREVSSNITDIVNISLLVWYGWLWSATAFSIGLFGMLVLFHCRKIPKKDEQIENGYSS